MIMGWSQTFISQNPTHYQALSGTEQKVQVKTIEPSFSILTYSAFPEPKPSRNIHPRGAMSIVPVNSERGVTTTTTNNSPFGDLWDVPEDFFPLDIWDPFQNFPFPSMLATHFPSSIFPSSLATHVNRRETPRAHVFRAVFRGGSNSGDVLVSIDDDNMLQISTEDGNFLSKFKLPEDAKRDEIKASMVNGVLTVTVPKVGASSRRPNVRVVDISGSG